LYTVSNRIIAALRRATRTRKVNINNIKNNNNKKETISTTLSSTLTPPSITTTTTKASF
jgi:hypothetical protein